MALNKVQLIGNVGKDPEIRIMNDSGIKVANFTLATTDRAYKMSNGTEVPEKTEWHNIVAWRGLAEAIEKYVHKGDKLYIEGKLRTRNYDDKQGIKHYITEIFVDNMEMLGNRPQQQPQQQPAYQQGYQQQPYQQPYQQQYQQPFPPQQPQQQFPPQVDPQTGIPF